MSEEDIKDEDDQMSGDGENAGNLMEEHPTLPQRSTRQKWAQPPCHNYDHEIGGECSENWDENHHSRQRICSQASFLILEICIGQ